MNYSIDNYIGQEVKRTTFLLKRPDKKYHYLYSIIERLENDAVENVIGPKDRKTVFEEKADGGKDKIFVEVDYVTLDEVMAKEPWTLTEVDGTIIENEGKGYEWYNDGRNHIVPSNRDERRELMVIVPQRRCSAFVKYCKPQERCDAVNAVIEDENLQEQLKFLSEKVLGYDLNLHRGFLGAYVLVSYNPVYKTIDFTEDAQNAGIYVRVEYRNVNKPLRLYITGLNKEGEVQGLEDCRINGAFLNHFVFERRYPLMEIIVTDEDNVVIDYYNNLAFIHSIQMGMSVKTKDVALIDEKGNVVRVVEKYSREIPSIIGENIEKQSIWDSSPEFEYGKLEQSLDFIFFDGEKDEAEQNHQRAIACVERILNQTKNVCYICDSYFDIDTLCQFVAPIKTPSVEVRVISSKERLGADDKEKLKRKTEEMRKAGLANVYCRMLKGYKSALHDRFIVSDDKVWMLGCSLNEFGKRATTLIRVPSRYCKKLIGWAETYWKDQELTDEL